MGYWNEIGFVGSISDIQLFRPEEHENFGLTVTFVSPPKHNVAIAEAMVGLAELRGEYNIEMKLTPLEEDEPV